MFASEEECDNQAKYDNQKTSVADNKPLERSSSNQEKKKGNLQPHRPVLWTAHLLASIHYAPGRSLSALRKPGYPVIGHPPLALSFSESVSVMCGAQPVLKIAARNLNLRPRNPLDVPRTKK